MAAADCLPAIRRNREADGAAPWQRAPPLAHVKVAAVRAGLLESCGHHAAEILLEACTAVRVPTYYYSVQQRRKVF